jgi:hypothetical protein
MCEKPPDEREGNADELEGFELLEHVSPVSSNVFARSSALFFSSSARFAASSFNLAL